MPMLLPSRRRFPPIARLLLASGELLAGCSYPSPTAPPAADAVKTAAFPAPAFPFGGQLDSLHGIAGHAFGEPLSAFPHLRRLPPIPGVPTRFFTYEGTTGWFGTHRTPVRDQLYAFLDGKFYAFMAIGDPAVLRSEAIYLFGPGQAQGAYQLCWEGSQARAVYTEKAIGVDWQGRLDVFSKSLDAPLAAKQQAHLKADNGQ